MIKSFEEILEEKGTLCYTSVGTSMLPLIREGKDIIVIRKRTGERLRKYDVAFFVRPGITGRGRYVLHRVLRVNPDGSYWIAGDNCTGGETVREENVIGVLSKVVRDGRTITDGNWYRLYVLVWCACRPVRFIIPRLNVYCRKARRMAARMLRFKRTDESR